MFIRRKISPTAENTMENFYLVIDSCKCLNLYQCKDAERAQLNNRIKCAPLIKLIHS